MNNRNWGGKRANAGRKATGRNTVSVTLTLTKDQSEELKQRAASINMTVSKFVVKHLNLDEQYFPHEKTLLNAADNSLTYNKDK